MASRLDSVSVKVTLAGHDRGKQIRRVTIPQGALICISEFCTLLADRFGIQVADGVTYIDNDDDIISVTTDIELREALHCGVKHFQIAADMKESEWEILGRAPEAISEPTEWKDSMTFWVNGDIVTLKNPNPAVTLLDWLREEHGLLGTHVGCGEGGCGICTVALQLPNGETVPINSCLRRLVAVDGCHIINTQGLGNTQTGLHALQTAIADGNGTQCGFCTPGWVMNMWALLENNSKPSQQEVEQNFDGNLCRCTGYRPILSAFADFADGGTCCGSSATVPDAIGQRDYSMEPLHFIDSQTGAEYYRPVSVAQLTDAVQQARLSKKVRYICGNTAEGVVKYIAPSDHDGESNTAFIDLNALNELKGFTVQGDNLCVGSLVSLTDLIKALETNSSSDPAFIQYANHIKRIASVQIRSVGSWAGNLMLCRESALKSSYTYFPSDLVLVLATAGAKVIVSVDQQRQVILDPLQLMRLDAKDVLVLSVQIPFSPAGSVVRTFKAMQRHVFAHAIVNFGAHITFQADGKTVKDARIIVGGATSQVVSAEETAACLQGTQMNQATLDSAMTALINAIKANPSNSETSTPAYQRGCATGFLYKTFLEVCKVKNSLPVNFESALVEFTPAHARPISSGKQPEQGVDYSVDPSKAPLGRWVPKLEARRQASGELRYASDIGVGALFSQLVISTTCNATLSGLDPSVALSMPGVKAFIVAADVPGLNDSHRNCNAPAPGSDFPTAWPVFWEIGDKIPSTGLPLGLIVADTWAQARRAAKKVVQRYADAKTPIISPEIAVGLGHVRAANPLLRTKMSSRMGTGRIKKPNGLPRPEADQSVSASVSFGGQSHFFLETMSACVLPDGEGWDVYCSNQYPDLVQSSVATVLGVASNQINAKNIQAGGGFGGKIYGCLMSVTAVAVAAHKLRRPVRLQNERSDDMQMGPQRHPLNLKYTATFDAQGMLDTLSSDAVGDAGWDTGPLPGFAGFFSLFIDNNYHWNVFDAGPGQDAITNHTHSTYMRAPPTMQAALAGEMIMDHVSRSVVGKDFDEVMMANLVQEGMVTPMEGNVIGGPTLNYTLQELLTQIQQDANYTARKQEVQNYNAANRWTKKGIALTTSRWTGSGGYFGFLNSAHVSIFGDGSVQVASGGVEIGQGLNTKVAMGAAYALGIPLERINVGSGDARMLPNNLSTGGSMTSETCVQAVLYACEELKTKLQPYLDAADGNFDAAVPAALQNGLSLVSTGWCNGEWDTNAQLDPEQSAYIVYGAGVAEVTVDVLTGDVQVDRVDLIMDLGNQMNAAIDIGQVQGGFVQALGYLFTEKLSWKEDGQVLSLGTWEYKPPSAYDIPLELNVALLKDTPNPCGVLGSKAVAEPAMHLIGAPYLAVKNAIYAAREELGHGTDWFMLNVPICSEGIRGAIDVPQDRMALP